MAFLAFLLSGIAVRYWLYEGVSSVTARRLQDGPENPSVALLALYCFGLFYMFVGIAIACDECFVPALEVIVERLDLSNDVAGATFMAAGGSAPEFFTSLIGAVFVESDIGTGTIIGSAVFNVLFVIGACGIAASEPIQLTWFPLARDASFYAIDLLVIVAVFLDEKVYWWEALILFFLYCCYGTFMVYSCRIEAWVGARLSDEKDAGSASESEEAQEEPVEAWAAPREPSPHLSTSAGTGEEQGCTSQDIEEQLAQEAQRAAFSAERSRFRHRSRRVSNAHLGGSSANLGKSLVGLGWAPDGDSTGGSTGDAISHVGLPAGNPPLPASPPHQLPEAWTPSLTEVVPTTPTETINERAKSEPSQPSCDKKKIADAYPSLSEGDAKKEEDDEEDDNVPMSLMPPEDGNLSDWLWYIGTLPLVTMLVITVPDVRRENCKKYFAFTFIMSIVWIAAFTWAMVWFATEISQALGLSEVIMGLTMLAAGTSVPDLITSMIVAREGFGDMAVSSSIGSNIFDVTVGLPVPWMLYAAVRNGKAVHIKNEGLEISVALLLAMLGLTIGTIMWHKWVLSRCMGISMMMLYLVFEAVAVGLTFAPEGSLKLIHV